MVLGPSRSASADTPYYPRICMYPSQPACYKAILTLSKGFILGEGFLSIVNLFLQGLGVPHL